MESAELSMMDGPGLNVRRFGARGDDATDDTAAIQRAIDAAGEVQGAAWFPPGQYRCGMLQLRTHVALVTMPTWAYGMVLKNLRNSAIIGNALHNAATRELFRDEGGHDAATVIRDNPGCLAPA